jgi:hypothetical protein
VITALMTDRTYVFRRSSCFLEARSEELGARRVGSCGSLIVWYKCELTAGVACIIVNNSVNRVND